MLIDCEPVPGIEATIEIRPVFEAEDFGDELTPELRAKEQELRQRAEGGSGLAEDLAQEAFVAALERWPESGVPDNPGAWLMATAKHRAIDRLRRAGVHDRKTQELAREIERRGEHETPDLAAAVDDPFDDDLLRLIFTACHPVLSTDARVALTLRLLGGLTTTEIARAPPRTRLGAHRRALRRPGRADALAGRRAQPRGGDRHGVRPGGGARAG